MKHKVLTAHAERTIAVVFEAGEEVIAPLTRFVQEHNVRAARFTAIGAFSDVRLGYFDVSAQDYVQTAIGTQVEVLSLIGDVAVEDGQPHLHAHVVVGKRDGTAHGGHLLSAHVRPTLEVLLIESPGYLVRRFDPRFGLPLIDIGA
jgi:predicted DNA-binding protein with PD1-like motif